MSAEHNNSPESTPEVSEHEREQQIERLRNNIEQEVTETDQPEQAEMARQKIEQQPEPGAKSSESEHSAPHHPTRFDKTASYEETMRSLRRRMSPAGQTFSRIIHTPVIEKTSDIAAKTVFRPSATLGATMTALIVGGATYFTARYYGFSLSGSEFILSLLVGGIIGLAVEFGSKLIRKKD